MEATVVIDAVTLSAFQSQAVFVKHLLHSAITSNGYAAAAACAGSLQISALVSPVDAISPPRARSITSSRTATRTLRKPRRCRTRRRRSLSSSGDHSDDGELFGAGEDGNNDDGTFGGSGGGGGGGRGGGGWNFDRFGWDDSSSYPADPAFDFVYEVVCWLLLSNCLHFAYKKVVRLVSTGIDDDGRQKVPVRLGSVC